MRSRLIATLIGTALASTTAYAALAESDDPARVDTANGAVRGTVTDTARSFEGIPYAAAPTGQNRWEPPVPADPWDGELDATRPGSSCPQPLDQPIAVPSSSEDCLRLNVTTPHDVDGGPRPVIVWIHGGSLTYGDGASYAAQRFAAQADAVVVSINYRLGALGFGGQPGDTVNLGLADQQLALQWVRNNVDAFGGDSRNVTIMGQSGGGYSVCAHLAAPGSAGLFDKAIVQSAGCVGSADMSMSLDKARQNWAAMAKALGKEPDDLDALRQLPAGDIVDASEAGHEGFRLVAGDSILPVDPSEAIASGQIHKVPVLYGSNSDEEAGRVAGMAVATGKELTADDYTSEVAQRFGDQAAAVLNEYPVDDYDSPSQASIAVNTDANWSYPAWRSVNAFAEHTRTYAYHFTAPTPWYAGFGRPSFLIGADHMAELAYLFDYQIFNPLTDEQQALADTMFGYWGSFARNANPNHDGAPSWHKYTPRHPYFQQLGTGGDGIGETDFAAAHHIDFWANLNA